VSLLDRPTGTINVGIDILAEAVERQGIRTQRVPWQPPPPEAHSALECLAEHSWSIASANQEVVSRFKAARPRLLGIARAADVIDGLEDRLFLHAGPPIAWEEMCGPLRGAICGAAVYEGVASDPDDAARRAQRGEYEFEPCHRHSAVGPMAGVISPSMPVWVVQDETYGTRAYCNLNEGLGKVLRYGANDKEVLGRLVWMRDVLARVLAKALERLPEPLDLKILVSQALQMGDEAHNRNRAGTSLLIRELAPSLLALEEPRQDVIDGVSFVVSNDHFFLNLSMAAAKATADAAAHIAWSTVVTAMARNGTEFGMRMAGTGDRWFVGPAGKVNGLYLPGFTEADANRDIGDSTITETIGLGAFAMAGAPAIVRFVGGTPADAVRMTEAMYDICVSESDTYYMPTLGFRGTPLGIDARAVVRFARLPAINTGIAHKDPGVGQVGAGLVEPPMSAFVDAVNALAERT
jgi:hypothetical protein